MSETAPSDTGSAVKPTVDEQRVRLRELMKVKGDGAWDLAWQERTTPWDAGFVQPPLVDFLKSSQGQQILSQRPAASRALVPGCGKGYDVALLASLGFDTWGVDLSETAVKIARETQGDIANATFKVLDFFKFDPPEGGFSLIYDYTFFCATPPDLRRSWGDCMRRLVSSGGHLITLVWPIDGPRTGGPPFSISVDLIADALNGGGSGNASFEKIVDVVPENPTEGHQGRERLAVWRRTD